MFSIRWYPESTSQYWYTDFVPVFDLADKQLLIWLFAIPLGAVYIHSVSAINCCVVCGGYPPPH